MGYPIPLGRYDQIRFETVRPRMNIEPSKMVEDAARWEIIGVTATPVVWLVLIGRVRVGLTVRTITNERLT